MIYVDLVLLSDFLDVEVGLALLVDFWIVLREVTDLKLDCVVIGDSYWLIWISFGYSEILIVRFMCQISADYIQKLFWLSEVRSLISNSLIVS